MFDIITFGSATYDIIVKPKRLTGLKYEKSEHNSQVCFPFGSKIELEDMQFFSGGGATNAAATFANQGFKTAYCGAIGQDNAGGQILRELKALGINTKLVVVTDQKLTNHSIVMLNGGQDRTILAYRGAAELMDKEQIPFKKLNTQWLYLAPLTGLAAQAFEELVNFAADQKIKIAVNPGMAQLSLPNFTDIAKKIDVLLLNQEEASFLTKIPVENEKEIFAKLDEMCFGIVVMTKGGKGVSVSDGKTMYSAVPPANRHIVDTTGAGDAFGSGFVAELMRGNNVEKVVQFAMANSVGCISHLGAKPGLLKNNQEFDRVEVVKNIIS